jgi:hypothetical protein
MIRLLAFVTLATLAQAVAASPTPVFKVFIEEAGVYSLSHEELVAAGLEPAELDSALVGMSSQGEAVPVWIEDLATAGSDLATRSSSWRDACRRETSTTTSTRSSTSTG